jgi:ornithine carbamoyltransferase
MSRVTRGGRGSVVADVRPGRHLGWFHHDNRVKDLLRLVDLSSEDLRRLRRLTTEFGSDAERHRRAPRDGTVLCWLTAPSHCVAHNVFVASDRLGSTTVLVDPDELRAGRVGSLENAGRVLSSLGRAIVVGGLNDRDLGRLATAASVPVVNAFSDGHDPCEAVAELATFERHFGSLTGFRLAYLGRACNVTHDLMAAAALAGIALTVATPDGCQPSPLVTVQTRDLAQRHGGQLLLTREPAQAVDRADGIVFGPLPPSWRHIRPEVVDGASPDAALLSCSPTGETRDWPIDPRRLLRADQQESRPCAYQAVLYALIERLLKGGGPNPTSVPEAIREAPLTPSTPAPLRHCERTS